MYLLVPYGPLALSESNRRAVYVSSFGRVAPDGGIPDKDDVVGVTKDMRLKGFSELAATTRAACTMLPRKTSVGGMRVFVWNQLTARCKYVIYKKHTPTRRKRPRPEPAPARRSADGP